jgi:exodeoxyribonuclease-3
MRATRGLAWTILLSEPLSARLADARVDRHVRGWERTSHHAPVWIELSDTRVRTRESRERIPE